jgi:hypothetical protein
MATSPLRSRWLPIVLCALVADLNFWYWASTGENDADFAGIVFFAAFGAVFLRDVLVGRRRRRLISLAGAVVALLMMVLRETGRLDLGYLPPYVVFIVLVWLGGSAA